jgi:CheY-like chemotaxis protein
MNNKIVIVEDHPILASIYQKKLTSEGYQVEIASDGQTGLDLINHISPDLVILDLIMPTLNGMEVLKTLRSNPLFKSLPVFIFSSSEWAGEALLEGATMVVSKSTCTPAQVVEMVRRLLPSV